MCAISCRIPSARLSLTVSVTLERYTQSSVIVTQPAFSMAPSLNSGTKSWSYLPKGYRTPNESWKKSKPCLVTSKISSGSR